ncbi:MAG TPA: hypothetical protein VGA08_02875 [Candidatus Saccharimonadales bacterium]
MLSDELIRKAKEYLPTDTARQVTSGTKLLLVAGPAGSGKDAIIKELVKDPSYTYIVSHTTRQPRTGEVNGRDYYFIGLKEMEKMIDEQRFVEAEAIYGEYISATSLAELKRIQEEGSIGVTDIDVYGVKTYIDLNSNTKAVFILPPSYEEWMRRLAERGSGEDQEALHRRLEDAQTWLEKALSAGYFRFVINTDIKQASADVRDYAESDRIQQGGADDTRLEHAWHVLGELKQQLNS